MNEEELDFSRAAVALLRGVVERRTDEALYQTIRAQEQALKEYFHRLGLLLTVDAADEYAYLRQDEASGVPRLMARTQLSYPLSLLLLPDPQGTVTATIAADGSLSIRAAGLPAGIRVLQTSTDLQTWTAVQSTADQTPVFREVLDRGVPQRFYRLVTHTGP